MQNPDFSYPQFVRSLFKQDTMPMMYLHAAMGIAGETFELYGTTDSEEEIKKELGDCCFYAQAMLNFFHEDIKLYLEVPRELDAKMFSAAGEILDCIKRWVIYGNGLDEKRLHRELTKYIPALFATIRSYGFTFEEVIDRNVEKLQKRHPSGAFTAKAAEEKADEKA